MVKRVIGYILLIFVLLSLVTACNLKKLVEESQQEPTAAIDLTKIALEVGGTLTAMPTRTPSAEETEPSSQISPTLPPSPPPTDTAVPQPSPTEAVPAQPTETASIPGEETDNAALEARIRASNILILEDVVANRDLVPRLDTAIAAMGFEGGTILNTYDASGNFLNQLKSGSNWDLIIVSIENRRDTRLGIWDVILERIQQNAAVIIEIYYLDEISSGQITPLLEGCGVMVQEDWMRRQTDPYGKFVLQAYDPAHPLFNNPNPIQLPFKPSPYWIGDAGDILELPADSSAQILLGLEPENRLRSGLLVSCYNGRVILQTFATHDYPKDQTIALWQNAIRFTLTNHYLTMP